jgi:hypothetical protein
MTAQFGEPGYTPEQYAAAAATVAGPPVGVGLPSGVENQVAGSGALPTEVDVNQLLAQLLAQSNAMAEEIARLKSGQAPAGDHPLIGTATAARDLIAQHLTGSPKPNSADILRLADDLVDASRNAVASGDPAAARKVAAQLTKELNRIHPGPGDHHYFTAALNLVGYHYGNAADTVTQARPSGAPAVGSSRPPAQVVYGSVTG